MAAIGTNRDRKRRVEVLSGVHYPCCLAAIGIWLYFPDTWGVPLEEIAEMFGDAEEFKVESVIDSEQVTLAEGTDKPEHSMNEYISSGQKEVA